MRSGIVTIAGRPNVGKSSLLNALIGRKVSIVSHKPQTTRHRIQGALHHGEDQIVFVDTPGLHLIARRALNRAMNQAAAGALHDVDLVLFVVEAGRWTDEDQAVLDRLKGKDVPVALIVNKIDRFADRERLLPELQKLAAMRDYAFIVPVSALRRSNLNPLRDEILAHIPEGPPLYPQGQVVAHGDDFTVAEVVREKLIRNLHQELPYSLTVEVELFEREQGLDRISAVIWVERDGQKKIVIGDGGETIKKVGSAARQELERMFGHKVFLKLWCKVRENWSDDIKALRRFGLSGQD
ncbi:GTPase Era [Sinimarinibacterium sp. NLF-5-8]|uniref:GTPase Era n=1 Tax=Sinimarinibacterium sp. NLF-5-8 TaxID=2698684 RepID=UPI00137BC14D|nr:GTPase Era [Sinimarinibacterium sp. NLF-5-8]QHS09826.1 GTPase Era [Sinimarinibacterium sp. NLF-5-8]